MKKSPSTYGLPALAALGLILASCGSGDGSTAAESGDGPAVLAAFYPLAFVAERVAGERASVENLTQPGVESHDLELTAQQVGAVADADLVLFLDEFQPAVDAAVEQNASGPVLDAGSVVELTPDAHDQDHDDESDSHNDGDANDDAHERDQDDGHDHGDLEGDPHLWLDPTNMVTLADVVADTLAEIDPDGADTYRANAAELTAELEELDHDFETGLAQCERSLVVVGHEAFGYLVDRYGLEQLGIGGLDPESEPAPARVAEVQDVIQDEGVTTVFHGRLTSPDVVESIAGDMGLQTAVLDPVEGLTDETADEDYLSLMRANLEAIRAANGCG